MSKYNGVILNSFHFHLFVGFILLLRPEADAQFTTTGTVEGLRPIHTVHSAMCVHNPRLQDATRHSVVTHNLADTCISAEHVQMSANIQMNVLYTGLC